ncbi:toprim domain-containing protein [Mycobacterium avium]|uniref:toprim domain-containing protein n=1 Tax=Mycobacterium avium TaxID=1764 RepID=UPI001EE1C209|nr:toprim domain-containing protein [Mycobacterium avium]
MRDALQAAGHAIRPRGSEAFMASCPLHTDHCPSLSVGWRENTRAGTGGAVLLHCFSCQAPAAAIAAALGLRLADLFDNPSPATGQRWPRVTQPRARRTPGPGPLPARITAGREDTNHHWRRARVYTYLTPTGTPVQQVVREECACTGRPHKQFRQRYRDGGQWVYRKPYGFTPVLYRPAAIAAAATRGAWIWVTEGEKDADTLTALGRLATTNAQGAANFPAELVDDFAGLKVAIVADRDLAGYQRAINLYARLRSITAQVVVLLPALDVDKADVTDHVNAGLWNRAELFGGLSVITPAELHTLAAAAKARVAAERFDVALQEARAHQDRRGLVPGSARNAARWLAEAAEQLRTVQHTHQDLHHDIGEQPSPRQRAEAAAIDALLEQLTTDYRNNTRRPAIHAGHDRLKESA